MNKTVKITALAGFVSLLIFSCSPKKADPHVITVAATPMPQEVLLKEAELELKKRGYTLKIVVMDDYNLPNRALADKEVDANFFQHLPFLEMQKKQFHYDICPLAAVHIEPMGGYSLSLKNLSDLKQKDTVAIPSDPSNEARALHLLEQQGLIELHKKESRPLTIQDITSNPKQLKIIEVDAPSLPRTLADVSIAFIPTNFALSAGLNPQNAIVIESKDSPYANVIAVRCEDLEEPKLKALKEAMTSKAMKEFIDKNYGGSIIPAFTSQDQ